MSSKIFRRTVAATAVGAMWAGGVSAALAQTTPSSMGQPIGGGQPSVRQERPDERSPSARAAENYNPTGVTVGSFRLFPLLELDEVYNDNIYATSYGTPGLTSSFIQIVRPSLQLRSDWSNHMLNFFAIGAIGFYGGDNSSNNYGDFSVGADGRLDIQRDWNTYGGASFNRLHEEAGTPNAALNTTQVTRYNLIVGNLGYFQTFNRFSVRLDSRVDNYVYDPNSLGPNQGVIATTDRDRTEIREALRLNYEISPGYVVFARGGLNQRLYSNVPDSSGFYRNSAGWDVVGGVAIDFGGITSVEAFFGYVQQNYVDSQFRTLSAPTFGLAAYWNPIRELLVKPFVIRTVNETSLDTASGYLDTLFGADVNYNLLPNIRLNALVSYDFVDYQSINTAPSRNDQYFKGRIGLKYLPTPNFYVGPEYTYTNRTSDAPNANYGQNIIMLRLGAQM